MQGRMPVWKRANWWPRFSVYWITPIREHMERRHWFFNAVQLAAIIGATYCWRHLPPTGYAIGIVAVLAAVMTVHGEMRHGHKVVWMLLIGAFLFIEFRAIDHDRADFAIKDNSRREEENTKFESIVKGLKTTIESQGTTNSELAEMKTRLQGLPIYLNGLQKGRVNDKNQIVEEIRNYATKPLSDLPAETLRKLAQDDSARLREVNFDKMVADGGPHYPSGRVEKWSPERIRQDRQEFYALHMENYRRKLNTVLPEADTVRKLMLRKVSERILEDDREAERFQAAMNGNIQDFSAGYAANYLESLSNRMKK